MILSISLTQSEHVRAQNSNVPIGYRHPPPKIQLASEVRGYLERVNSNLTETNLVRIYFCIELNGDDPVSFDIHEIPFSYTNSRTHVGWFDPDESVIQILQVQGDGDSVLENNEVFEVILDLSLIEVDDFNPKPEVQDGHYPHPYEEFRVEINPPRSSTFSFNCRVPKSNLTICVLDQGR